MKQYYVSKMETITPASSVVEIMNSCLLFGEVDCGNGRREKYYSR